MKKGAIAIISSLCTIVVCFGVFSLYLNFNNSTQEKRMNSKEKVEAGFKYEKTLSVYIRPLYTDEIDETSINAAFSEVLKNDKFLNKITEKHPKVNYDIKLGRIKDTDIFQLLFKSDTEELSSEICDFLIDTFIECVERVLGYECAVVDYTS